MIASFMPATSSGISLGQDKASGIKGKNDYSMYTLGTRLPTMQTIS